MLEQFRDAGAVPTGIGLDRDNYKSCDDKGFDVSIMDQSFMDFPDGTFDVLWSQHVLEHSIFPFFTLHEYKRVVRSGGLIYIEVPAPDTSFNHQDDPNHYSVFGKSAWLSLMARTGLRIVDHAELNSLKDSWQDNKYFSFILRKEEK
jgi:SAM-dependent methyltransferase